MIRLKLITDRLSMEGIASVCPSICFRYPLPSRFLWIEGYTSGSEVKMLSKRPRVMTIDNKTLQSILFKKVSYLPVTKKYWVVHHVTSCTGYMYCYIFYAAILCVCNVDVYFSSIRHWQVKLVYTTQHCSTWSTGTTTTDVSLHALCYCSSMTLILSLQCQ